MMHLYWHKVSQAIKVAVVGVSLPLLLSSAGLAQQNVQQDAVEVNTKIKEPIEMLMDDNEGNDQTAIDKLKENKDIVDLLIQEFNNTKNSIEARIAILQALGEVDHESEKAVDQFMKIIEDKNENTRIRIAGTENLLKSTKKDEENINKLITQLEDSKNGVSFREWSLYYLNREIASKKLTLDNQKIFRIVGILPDDKREVYVQASEFLSESLKIDNSSDLVSKFKKITQNKDENWKTRIGVAQALGFSGQDVKLSMEVLTEFLQAETPMTQKEYALDSIQVIADELSQKAYTIANQEDQKKKWLAGLNLAQETLKQNNPELKNNQLFVIENSLKNAIETINLLPKPANSIWIWLTENKKLSIPIFLFSFWLFLLFLLLRVKPLSLLLLNSFLQKTDLSLEFIGFNFKTATLRILLFDLQYHPRVLDDWVKTNLETARRQFENKQTVKQRNIYVPTIPVILNGDSIPELTPKDLQYKFNESRETLLIWGEGGSGKTTLACQLAKWAMADEPEQRLCPNHRMLPIFIDQELSDETGNQQQVLMEAIHGQLRDLIEAVKPISEELLEHLLRERRLLVIVDGYSEMRPATRNKIKPELPSFVANALILTSRNDESLGGVNKTIIQMMRVQSSKLAEFLQAYVNKKGKQNLFKTDQELFQACIQLSQLVGERDITVLLAKLYADQLIANESNQTTKNLPDNIPDLMLSYLNQINCQLIEKGLENHLDNLTVHQVAKVIAWQCLKQTYRSTTIPLDTLLKVLGEHWSEEQAKTHLKYLENSLHIVETVKPSEDQIRFSLDPLAEFLAGLYLVDLYKDNEKLWTEFLAQADAQPGAPESIKGFLQAVQDCCQKKKDIVPRMILEELSQKIADCDSNTTNSIGI
ncbi:NACHT domain-containing protein [Planktothrix agardhii]|jgi:HEAT repeat protein|nr:NACHT domain-containing protein [Planktothrix agardhii]MCF3578515.1 NACHT domain-containing protein [Planktothrix agardhii 1812]MCF3644682.1 NACHT domain-containing protein [Planktothrix agardhii 1026]MCF3647299.1 NACHT domain-containing protein [Planktothrix agardhii 1026]